MRPFFFAPGTSTTYTSLKLVKLVNRLEPFQRQLECSQLQLRNPIQTWASESQPTHQCYTVEAPGTLSGNLPISPHWLWWSVCYLWVWWCSSTSECSRISFAKSGYWLFSSAFFWTVWRTIAHPLNWLMGRLFIWLIIYYSSFINFFLWGGGVVYLVDVCTCVCMWGRGLIVYMGTFVFQIAWLFQIMMNCYVFLAYYILRSWLVNIYISLNLPKSTSNLFGRFCPKNVFFDALLLKIDFWIYARQKSISFQIVPMSD